MPITMLEYFDKYHKFCLRRPIQDLKVCSARSLEVVPDCVNNQSTFSSGENNSRSWHHGIPDLEDLSRQQAHL